jgi:hypothetical protein
MQYYKRTLGVLCSGQKDHPNVNHRHDYSNHGMLPAQDIFIFAPDPARDPDRLYMTIKNPSKPYRPAY